MPGRRCGGHRARPCATPGARATPCPCAPHAAVSSCHHILVPVVRRTVSSCHVMSSCHVVSSCHVMSLCHTMSSCHASSLCHTMSLCRRCHVHRVPVPHHVPVPCCVLTPDAVVHCWHRVLVPIVSWCPLCPRATSSCHAVSWWLSRPDGPHCGLVTAVSPCHTTSWCPAVPSWPPCPGIHGVLVPGHVLVPHHVLVPVTVPTVPLCHAVFSRHAPSPCPPCLHAHRVLVPWHTTPRAATSPSLPRGISTSSRRPRGPGAVAG